MTVILAYVPRRPTCWAKSCPRESKPSPALTQSLSDSEYRVRIAAARALGEIGPAANDVFSNVAALLADPVADVRLEAMSAMVEIKGK